MFTDESTRDSTAQATRDHLDALQQQTATILSNVFNVDVELETSARFCSWSDLCATHPTTSPTATQVMNALNNNSNLLRDGSNNDHPCAHCTATCTRTGAVANPTLSNSHHRNGAANLAYYASKKTNPEPAVWVLFSGYDPCYNGNGTHEYNAIAGLAAGSWQQTNGIWNRPCGVFFDENCEENDNARKYRDRLTALHEISHCLGASKTAYSLIDDDHGNCVMSYDRDNSNLVQWFDSAAKSDHLKLYCDNCLNAISTFLKYY